MKYQKFVLLALSLVLIAVNFYVLAAFGIQESRWARLVSSLLFFGLFLKLRRDRGTALLAAMGLLSVSDMFLTAYEVPLAQKSYSSVVMIAYLLLILHIGPMIRKLRANLFQKVVFVLVLGINLLMLFFLADMIELRLDELQISFLILHGILMIALVVLAFSYTHRYSSKPSFYFMCAVLGLVFSDISGFISYYMQVREFAFPDRGLYILALASLVRFASLEKDEVMNSGKSLL